MMLQAETHRTVRGHACALSFGLLGDDCHMRLLTCFDASASEPHGASTAAAADAAMDLGLESEID